MRPVVLAVLGGEDAPVLHEAPVAVDFFHDHPEGVAGLQLVGEVDVPGEQLREGQGQGVVFPGAVHRLEQRAADVPPDLDDAVLRGERRQLGLPAAGGRAQDEGLERAFLVGQAHEVAAGVEHDGEAVADAQAPEIQRRGEAVDDVRDELGVEPREGEVLGEADAGADHAAQGARRPAAAPGSRSAGASAAGCALRRRRPAGSAACPGPRPAARRRRSRARRCAPTAAGGRRGPRRAGSSGSRDIVREMYEKRDLSVNDINHKSRGLRSADSRAGGVRAGPSAAGRKAPRR